MIGGGGEVNETPNEMHFVDDDHRSQAVVRSRLLRENGKFLPKQAFLMRRHFFNSDDGGYFKTQRRAAPAANPMTDPNAMTGKLPWWVTTPTEQKSQTIDPSF